jgi:thiosulfate/3-mercaptopyruvate sulfurtransferase
MSPLIAPSELADLPEVTVLDVRWKLGGPPGIDSYREEHIPGAVFCDLDADLAAPPGPRGRHPLPSAESFQEAARRLGVSGSRTVVVYDGADSSAAARAWWTLRYFGHPDVRVLDGGLRAWTSQGLPLSKGEEIAAPGDFVARPGGMPVLDAAQAMELAADGVLLDARAAERYRGEVEPIDPVAGHIPGAQNLPYTDGDALPEELLIANELVVYCGSGITACVDLLRLAHAGRDDAKLYAGSWSDWSSRGLPAERG